MSLFPANARTGQTHKKFGRKYVYSETTETWQPVVPLASKAEIKRAAATATGATTFYDTAAELPLSNNTTGAMAFVQETNRLYIWSGTGWYNIATIESAGASISGANASYALASNGTPTVVTLTQSGLTSPTWSYEVTSGSLGRTATVTQSDNVFTITPSTRARDIGSFGITFKATDGSNTLVTTSQFTMSNTAPVIGTGPSATYALASDGTPTVITLAATDADGHDITWSYEVVSGSLGGTTVSISGSEFTITPSTNLSDAGTFQLRFIASDGFLFDAEVSQFTLAFGKQPLYSLTNPNAYGTSANDGFGVSVAMSGNYAIVGAWGEEDAGGNSGSGAAYIYNVSTGQLLHTLTNPNAYGTALYDYFGVSVAIDGTYAVVGAYSEDEYNGDASGKAYVFSVSTGALVSTLNNPSSYGSKTSDSFGKSVAISGSYVIVGADLEDQTNGSNAGKVYVMGATTGGLNRTIHNPQTNAAGLGNRFGFSISANANYLLIGAPYDSANGGKAYIFGPSNGTLLRTFTNPNTYGTFDNDQFGYSVAISTTNYNVSTCYCAISAYQEDDADGSGSGKVYIFNAENGAFVRTIDNPNAYDTSTSDGFGNSVGISGNLCIIGATAEDDAGGSGSGKAYIFNVTTGALVHTLNNPNPLGTSVNDQFGYSVAISGTKAIVGARLEDEIGNDSGKAYIYTTS